MTPWRTTRTRRRRDADLGRAPPRIEEIHEPRLSGKRCFACLSAQNRPAVSPSSFAEGRQWGLWKQYGFQKARQHGVEHECPKHHAMSSLKALNAPSPNGPPTFRELSKTNGRSPFRSRQILEDRRSVSHPRRTPGGPRYNANQTAEQRRSIENAIWLCTECSTRIDKDQSAYPVDILAELKRKHETWIRNGGIVPSLPVLSLTTLIGRTLPDVPSQVTMQDCDDFREHALKFTNCSDAQLLTIDARVQVPEPIAISFDRDKPVGINVAWQPIRPQMIATVSGGGTVTRNRARCQPMSIACKLIGSRRPKAWRSASLRQPRFTKNMICRLTKDRSPVRTNHHSYETTSTEPSNLRSKVQLSRSDSSRRLLLTRTRGSSRLLKFARILVNGNRWL